LKTVVIGAGVMLSDSAPSFSRELDWYYTEGRKGSGKRAGTYYYRGGKWRYKPRTA